jgi:virginiamycin B lyase
MSGRYFLLAATALLATAGSADAQDALPEGKGKQIVETVCVACHDLRRLTGFGYTPDEWHNVVSMMVNVGAPLEPPQVAEVTDYLITNFPEHPKPAAVIIPGPAQVSFQEWQVPTPGSRPHDPLATDDGAIWYSGQMANVLGRLDPATGAIKEYKLPTEKSGPHGLIADKTGGIWFTANFHAYIGRLDPATGEVVEYPMPKGAARDPHTLQLDQKGVIWFTAQGANMVGRLTPETHGITAVSSPTPRSNPYGMVINSSGVPFFDEFGTNKIGSIDPATMAIREYSLPSPEARPRRIAITSDDVIWYTDYGRGYLGRLDPATGTVTEFASPGGAKSQPYGIAVVDGIIWYSESGVKPNTLVRFDPRGAAFQSWAIPSGGGVVRNMVATRDGKLALACSGVNGIALVTIK